MFLAGEGKLRKGNRPAKIFVDLRRQSGGTFASGEVIPIRELSSGQWEPRGKPIRFYVSGDDDTMARDLVEQELDHHFSEFTLRNSRKNPAIDPDLLSQEKNSKAIMEAYESGVRNFRMGDFSGMFLAGMDFSGSNMELANFQGADLQGADFQNCNLESAVFDGANLANAAFSKSNLENANLENVDGSSAYFEETNLVNASFRGSDLRGATFKDATFDKTDFRDADLRDAYLETPYIGTVDFRGANIHKWPQVYAEAILTGEQKRNPGPKAHHKTGIKMMKDARKCWDRYCKHQDIVDALDCFEMLSVAHQELSYAKDKDNLKEVKQGLREVKDELESCLKAHKKKPEESDMSASEASQVEKSLDRNPLKRGQTNPLSASEIKKIRRLKLRKAMKDHGVSDKHLSKIKSSSTRSKLRKSTKSRDSVSKMVSKIKKESTRSKIRKATKNPITDGRKVIKEAIAELNEFQINQLGGMRGAQVFAEDLWESADLSDMPMRDRKRWIVDHMMGTAERLPRKKTPKATKNPGRKPTLTELRKMMPAGWVIKKDYGDEYVVYPRGADEARRYYTSDWEDAVATAKLEARMLNPKRSKKKVSKARRNPEKVYGHQFKVNQVFPEPSVDIVDREAFIASDHGLDEAEVTELMRMREGSSVVVGGLKGGPMYSVYRGKGRDPSLPYEERLKPIAGEFDANPRRRRRNPGVFLRTVQKQIERLDNGRLVLKRDELRDHLASMKDARNELGPVGYEVSMQTLKMYEDEIKSRGLKTNPAPKGKLTQKQASDLVKKEKIRLGKLPKKYYPMWVETYEAAKSYYGDAQTGGRVAWAQVKKYCEKKGEKWVCGPLPKPKSKAKKKRKKA